MKLNIISDSETVYTGEVESVKLPGVEGQFTVLKNHASLISVLQKGDLVYRDMDTKEEHRVNVKGGLADIDNNKISVCIY